MRRSEGNQHTIKKPSLLSGVGDAVAANSRILTTLEHGSHGGKGSPVRKPPVGRQFIGIVGVLSIFGAGAAIFIYQNTAPPAQPEPLQAGSPHASPTAKNPDSISAPAPAAAPQGLAALIVNEPVAAAGADAPRIVAEPAKPALAVNSHETRVLPLNAINKVPHTGSISVQKHPASSPKSSASTKTHAAPSVLAARHADRSNKNPASSTEKRGVIATKGQTADPDVVLLEALVARAAEPSVRTLESAKKSAKNAPPPAPTTLAKTGDSNHDFVERKPGDSTESLLLRCKQLGFFEGGLCRWRMCSGRWNTDQACKVAQESQ